MIKAAIFDVDGTLVDTEYYQWQGWVELLKPYDIKLSKEAYYNYAGKAGNIAEAEIRRDFKLKDKPGVLLKKKEDLLIEKTLKQMPYAKEAAEFFVNRKIKIAVAGGSTRDEITLKLKKTGLDIFPLIVSGTEVEKGKPHPDVYLLTAKRLRVKPEECVVFEDTQYGLEAAKGAGMTCLAVPSEFSKKQDFSKADGVFASLKEAIDWVKENLEL